MATKSPSLQEGTDRAPGHSDVTVVHGDIGACQAVTDVLSRIGDKWSMQVVIRLGEGPLRFNELKRAVDGISQRMLTRTLRGLERDGLVNRTVTANTPPRVDYALTDLGRSLWMPVSQVGAWAVAHRQAISQARRRYDAQDAAD